MVLKEILEGYKKPIFRDMEYIAIVRFEEGEDGELICSYPEIFDAIHIDIAMYRYHKYRNFPVYKYRVKMETIGMDGTVQTDGKEKPVLYVYVFDPNLERAEWLGVLL